MDCKIELDKLILIAKLINTVLYYNFVIMSKKSKYIFISFPFFITIFLYKLLIFIIISLKIFVIIDDTAHEKSFDRWSHRECSPVLISLLVVINGLYVYWRKIILISIDMQGEGFYTFDW